MAQQDPPGSGVPRLHELSKQCELLQAATTLAWGRAVEAYKATSSGVVDVNAVDPTTALVQYQSAKALQQVADQALRSYLKEQHTSKDG
jgi:hypothetical protein